MQDSERADLCKIVAQGGERQAGVQRSVQEAGGAAVCARKRGRQGKQRGLERGERVVRGVAGGGI